VTSSQHSLQPSAVSVESTWIVAAQKGDIGCFNRLVENYEQICFNVALRLVNNPDAAADVTQDAFLSAYRHLDQFKGGSFRSWLLRIVTNASYDALRIRRRHDNVSLDLLVESSAFDVPDLSELPEELTLRGELFGAIQTGLDQLPIDQRSVVVLCDVHGLSYDEAATVLTTNVGTIKSRLSRGRGRLRDFLLGHPELWKS
jgi:RNA polymerase sigma-70 factor (ECF subfamily)